MNDKKENSDVFDVIHSMLWNTNVEYFRELILFQSHHTNTINWFIHALTIPMEWFGWLILTSFVRLHIPISVIIALYYTMIKSKAANFSSCLHIFLGMLTEVLIQNVHSQRHLLILSFGLQFSAWILQVFIGHWVYENNNPSMMKKLTFNSIILSILLVFDPRKMMKKMKQYE